jgi:uncharacterized protein YidB (DUF937 family)
MGLFDDLRSAGAPLGPGEAHNLLDGVLRASPFGGVSGLIDRLKQGGLGEAVEAWREGAPAIVGPDELRAALGEADVQQAAASLGVSPDQMLVDLAEHLPTIAAHTSV